MKFRSLTNRVAAIALIALATFTPTKAHASPSYGAESTVRSSAILTTSDVYSTFALTQANSGFDYYIVYANFTLGSLTNCTVEFAGADASNPASTGYYKSDTTSYTLTASGRWAWLIPKTAFRGPTYGAVVCKGSGTATSSAIGITVTPYRSQ